MVQRISGFQVSAEVDLLMRLAAGGELTSSSVEAEGAFDWLLFRRLVAKNRLEPLIAEALPGLKASGEGEVMLRGIEQDRKAYALVALQQMYVLTQIITLLSESGIRALALKGPLLAISLFGNPGKRFSRDLDIFVDPDRFDEAHKLMLGAGWDWSDAGAVRTPKRYKKWREYLHHAEYEKGGICFELHWQLLGDEYTYEDRSTLFERLWQQRRVEEIGGIPVCTLGDMDNAAYLTMHAAIHGFNRMRWLVDIYRLLELRGWDIEPLLTHMEDAHQRIVLLEALLLIYRCPQFPVKPIESSLFSIRRQEGDVLLETQDALAKDMSCALELTEMLMPILLSAKPEEESLDLRRYHQRISAMLGKRNAFMSFLRHMQPKYYEWQRFDFPDSLYFLYHVVHPFYRLWQISALYRR